MLPLRLLWRNWRSGELTILALALVLAVSVVGGISIFTDRLENSLIRQSHEFLGADRIVRSGSERPDHWEFFAENASVETALTAGFSSMVFSGDDMHLAAVKAVSGEYPLLGQLVVSDEGFADSSQHQSVQTGPPSGEAWVDARLLPLLNVEVGDNIQVGARKLLISRILVSEPDRGSMMSMLGARVMMNYADLESTEVIQPGSRVRYQWMLSAPPSNLNRLLSDLEPEFASSFTVVDLDSSQQGLGRTLGIARQFLMLAASIGVLLSGVAIAISARRFAGHHIDQVALIKSLGASRWRVRYLYGMQMLWLGIFATVVGVAIAEGLQRLIATALSALFPVALQSADLGAYGVGMITGMVCLGCFVLPPLWFLPSVPPIKVLRREIEIEGTKDYWQLIFGITALVVLIAFFTRDLQLVLSFLAVVALIIFSIGTLAAGLLRGGDHFGRRFGNIWRLAFANLNRYRFQTYVQTGVFAVAIMLLLSLTAIRTSLISDWQMQLPDDAPNHFFLNIADYEVEPLDALLQAEGLSTKGLYPVVRGRLTHINGKIPTDEARERAHILRSEGNLSWIDTLGEDNEIVAGEWWDSWQGEGHGVSIEKEMAELIGVTIGDQLTFNIGGFDAQVEVASIRELRWDSMNPNFFFLMSPGALDDHSPTYLTSVFLPQSQKTVINSLLREYPTIVVIEMDRVIAQIQAIISQVSRGIELVLWLVLVGGVLVMWSAVSASMDIRLKEAALLRALGSSSKRLLGGLGAEFLVIGLSACLIAVMGAQLLIYAVQHWVLQIPGTTDYVILAIGFVFGTLVITAMGLLACRKVVSISPGVILRGLD